MIFARNELRLRGKVGTWCAAMCLLMAVIAIALLASDALSQEPQTDNFDLVGTVVDDVSGGVLVGAWVSLEGAEWGSITDEKGRFRLPDVSAGAYAITVEQLGYETLVWTGEVAPDGPLALRVNPQPLLLEGLQVVTDRFRSRRNRTAQSVVAYDRADLATSPQTNVVDFVALRVGTSRDRCGDATRGNTCFRFRGRSVEPAVFVDEVRVLAGLDYLDALAPHELQLVEVFGSGRHIRAYTNQFMTRAARTRLQPVAILF